MTYTLHLGDCLDVLKTLPDASVDAVVTDPPYELGFMGKRWDASGIAYNVGLWTEALRVLKPGGHLLAFGGTRTYHRMACAIEDAGFEMRDSLHWIYGSGFPKSLDVSKAIDKAAGAEREVLGKSAYAARANTVSRAIEPGGGVRYSVDTRLITAPATDAARQWDGWGTALKPAHEPVVVARKPLVGTVADNVQAHGTGALNIDGCRVAAETGYFENKVTQGGKAGGGFDVGASDGTRCTIFSPASAGRWPPNILLSHTPECGEACAEDCAVTEMDRQSGNLPTQKTRNPQPGEGGVTGWKGKPHSAAYAGEQGGASRFFPVFRYQAKASRSERECGCDGLPARSGAAAVERAEGSAGTQSPRAGAGRTATSVRNHHPTVKPVELMRWLVRLVTPPNGVVLDPFTGSGTTGVAAMLEGFRFVGVEREAEYHAIASARIEHAIPQPHQMELLP